MPSKIRVILNRTYLGAGYLAAVFLTLILLLISLQMLARWTNFNVAGASELTGYCLAAASFLAFPYALNTGSHIRVSLILGMAGRYRWHLELWCWVFACIFACLFAWFAIKLTIESYRWNVISDGHDALPLWIPQIAMSVGTFLFAICTLDNIITHLLTGKDNIKPIRVESH